MAARDNKLAEKGARGNEKLTGGLCVCGGLMLKDMKAYKHVKPGQPGVMALQKKYGDSLVCVRYRYDSVRKMKVKTVELVIEETPCVAGPAFRADDIVLVEVSFTEKLLREALKAAGGKWDPSRRLWRARYGAIRGNAALVVKIVG